MSAVAETRRDAQCEMWTVTARVFTLWIPRQASKLTAGMTATSQGKLTAKIWTGKRSHRSSCW
jgi:hypothetical protein